MKIGFIPIDNRPVCYTLPEQIAEIDESIEFFMPKREWLGDLKKYADTEKMFKWLKNLPKLDALILPLDTLAYGGLISSRRCSDSFDEIMLRLDELKKILIEKDAKIYAFSSIMRISNNNVNEEEKEYWDKWGKKIFNYSYCMHKFGTMCKKEVPDEILEDYLKTRERNFNINKVYLGWQKDGIFDTLIFSKDDCAEYGLNVQEAEAIENLGGFVKTGADEIPLTLFARSLEPSHDRQKEKIKICPIFLEPKYKDLISNYEDISIEKSVKGQIELAGFDIAGEANADILLYINNFVERQGEIVMKTPTEPFNKDWQMPKKPYVIADVRFANGADNGFVKKLFNKGLGKNFLGYSAWNTSANTLGSLLCAAKVRILAKKYNDRAFKRLQAIRFLDDWAYQANVRQMLSKPCELLLNEQMEAYEQVIFKQLGEDYKVNYSLPWNRLFEVEIGIN